MTSVRRLLTILVLCLLLPLQTLAATVMPVCAHESGALHAHQHHAADAGSGAHAHHAAQAATTDIADIADMAGAAGPHAAHDAGNCDQCGLCHLSCAGFLPASYPSRVTPHAPTGTASFTAAFAQRPPERLQRPPIAAAL